MTTELFIGLAKRTLRMLSRDSINVNLKTQVGRNLILSRRSLRSLPVARTVKQVELASNSDPEIASLRQYILSGDWSR